jgi:hypothetical protein
MSRKKKETDVLTNGTPDDTTAVAELTPPEVSPPPANTHGTEKPQPLVSYRLSSDRTTSIELAVWSHFYKNQQGEDYEQLSMTVQRSYKDTQGVWQNQARPSWRTHDLPVLLFLLQKAHSFAMNRRCDDSSIPF